jgi:hypothetical protein
MKKRNYSLFTKEYGKYVRLSPFACSLNAARRLFQGALIGGSMIGYGMYLRPAEEDFDHSAKYKADRDRIFPVTDTGTTERPTENSPRGLDFAVDLEDRMEEKRRGLYRLPLWKSI